MLVIFLLFEIQHLLQSQKFLQLKKENVANMLREIEELKKELNIKEMTLTNVSEELNKTNLYLNLKEIELEKLKVGNRYELQNLFYEDVKSFMEESIQECDSSNCIVNRAKENGIRCGYVQVYTTREKYYPLIRFDTLDRGTIYFNSLSSDPVELSSFEPIKNILVIW
jgi:hypothetical protein